MDEDVTELALNKYLQTPLYWIFVVTAIVLHFLGFQARSQRFLETTFIADPKRLTYNDELIRYIEAHRTRKGTVILATVSHYKAALPIARHVHLLDDVLGSCDPQFNQQVWDAKADEKARLLDLRFPNGFLYASNSQDDIKVWQHDGCKAMLLVNCDEYVLQQAKGIPKPFIVIR